jgi:septal ring factor EnvC (AmiA/AmiB activator)
VGARSTPSLTWVLVLLSIGLAHGHAQAKSAPVDPDSLLVPEPKIAPKRIATDEINQLLRTELSILEGVQELDMNMARRTTELERLDTQEKAVEKDLLEMTERFDALSDKLDDARRSIRGRLRAMSQLKRIEPYQLLFASSDHVSFLRRQRGVRALLDGDRERVLSYRAQLAQWSESRDDLIRRRTNLRRTRETISSLIDQLGTDREEKALLLDAVRSRAAFHAKLNQEMKGVNRELRDKVLMLRDPSRRGLRMHKMEGKLWPPIRKGQIIGRFGIRKNSRFGTKTIHRGIEMIPAASAKSDKTRIRNIYWGYVSYVGWLKGLGKTVIVDHTRGYMTLYAHLSETAVEEDMKLATGDTIGIMGETGSLYGPRLYMELRKDGRAIDPEPWFKW